MFVGFRKSDPLSDCSALILPDAKLVNSDWSVQSAVLHISGISPRRLPVRSASASERRLPLVSAKMFDIT